jgi:hypothetical protein
MSLTNRFGWSVSREALFDECRRRYYFHYYLSWGGWEPRASVLAREAFKLKRLVSLSLWRGQLVHYIVSKFLQSMKAKGRVPDREAVTGYLLERFDSQFAFSRDKRYLTTPKKSGSSLTIDWLALIDHEYDRPIADELRARTRAECVRGIEGLYECPLLGTLRETDPAGWVIEEIDTGSFSQSFPFGGVTVYLKTDFIFRDTRGNLCIVDWKTNAPTEQHPDAEVEEPRNAAIQLGVYQYYAVHALGEPLDSIRLYEVNLLDRGRVREHAANESAYRSAGAHIEEGIRTLASVLVDADTDRNEPLPAEHFPTIENGRCRFCNFFRICKDENFPHHVP